MNHEALITGFVRIQDLLKKGNVTTKEAVDILVFELTEGKPATPEERQKAETWMKQNEKKSSLPK